MTDFDERDDVGNIYDPNAGGTGRPGWVAPPGGYTEDDSFEERDDLLDENPPESLLQRTQRLLTEMDAPNQALRDNQEIVRKSTQAARFGDILARQEALDPNAEDNEDVFRRRNWDAIHTSRGIASLVPKIDSDDKRAWLAKMVAEKDALVGLGPDADEETKRAKVDEFKLTSSDRPHDEWVRLGQRLLQEAETEDQLTFEDSLDGRDPGYRPGLVRNVVGSFLTGWTRTLNEGIAGTADMAGLKGLSKWASENADTAVRMAGVDEDFANSTWGGVFQGFGQLALIAGTSLLTGPSGLLAGGARVAGGLGRAGLQAALQGSRATSVAQKVSFATVYGLNAGAEYMDAYDQAISNGYSPEEAKRIAMTYGLSSGAVDTIANAFILGKLFRGGFGSKAQAALTATQKEAPTSLLTKLNQWSDKGTASLVKTAGSGFVVEGTTEGLQRAWQNVLTDSAFFEGVAHEALIGGIVGGSAKVGSRALSGKLDSITDERLEEMGFTPEQREALTRITNMAELTDDNRVALGLPPKGYDKTLEATPTELLGDINETLGTGGQATINGRAVKWYNVNPDGTKTEATLNQQEAQKVTFDSKTGMRIISNKIVNEGATLHFEDTGDAVPQGVKAKVQLTRPEVELTPETVAEMAKGMDTDTLAAFTMSMALRAHVQPEWRQQYSRAAAELTHRAVTEMDAEVSPVTNKITKSLIKPEWDHGGDPIPLFRDLLNKGGDIVLSETDKEGTPTSKSRVVDVSENGTVQLDDGSVTTVSDIMTNPRIDFQGGILKNKAQMPALEIDSTPYEGNVPIPEGKSDVNAMANAGILSEWNAADPIDFLRNVAKDTANGKPTAKALVARTLLGTNALGKIKVKFGRYGMAKDGKMFTGKWVPEKGEILMNLDAQRETTSVAGAYDPTLVLLHELHHVAFGDKLQSNTLTANEKTSIEALRGVYDAWLNKYQTPESRKDLHKDFQRLLTGDAEGFLEFAADLMVSKDLQHDLAGISMGNKTAKDTFLSKALDFITGRDNSEYSALATAWRATTDLTKQGDIKPATKGKPLFSEGTQRAPIDDRDDDSPIDQGQLDYEDGSQAQQERQEVETDPVRDALLQAQSLMNQVNLIDPVNPDESTRPADGTLPGIPSDRAYIGDTFRPKSAPVDPTNLLQQVHEKYKGREREVALLHMTPDIQKLHTKAKAAAYGAYHSMSKEGREKTGSVFSKEDNLSLHKEVNKIKETEHDTEKGGNFSKRDFRPYSVLVSDVKRLVKEKAPIEEITEAGKQATYALKDIAKYEDALADGISKLELAISDNQVDNLLDTLAPGAIDYTDLKSRRAQEAVTLPDKINAQLQPIYQPLDDAARDFSNKVKAFNRAQTKMDPDPAKISEAYKKIFDSGAQYIAAYEQAIRDSNAILNPVNQVSVALYKGIPKVTKEQTEEVEQDLARKAAEAPPAARYEVIQPLLEDKSTLAEVYTRPVKSVVFSSLHKKLAPLDKKFKNKQSLADILRDKEGRAALYLWYKKRMQGNGRYSYIPQDVAQREEMLQEATSDILNKTDKDGKPLKDKSGNPILPKVGQIHEIAKLKILNDYFNTNGDPDLTDLAKVMEISRPPKSTNFRFRNLYSRIENVLADVKSLGLPKQAEAQVNMLKTMVDVVLEQTVRNPLQQKRKLEDDIYSYRLKRAQASDKIDEVKQLKNQRDALQEVRKIEDGRFGSKNLDQGFLEPFSSKDLDRIKEDTDILYREHLAERIAHIDAAIARKQAKDTLLAGDQPLDEEATRKTLYAQRKQLRDEFLNPTLGADRSLATIENELDNRIAQYDPDGETYYGTRRMDRPDTDFGSELALAIEQLESMTRNYRRLAQDLSTKDVDAVIAPLLGKIKDLNSRKKQAEDQNRTKADILEFFQESQARIQSEMEALEKTASDKNISQQRGAVINSQLKDLRKEKSKIDKDIEAIKDYKGEDVTQQTESLLNQIEDMEARVTLGSIFGKDSILEEVTYEKDGETITTLVEATGRPTHVVLGRVRKANESDIQNLKRYRRVFYGDNNQKAWTNYLNQLRKAGYSAISFPETKETVIRENISKEEIEQMGKYPSPFTARLLDISDPKEQSKADKFWKEIERRSQIEAQGMIDAKIDSKAKPITREDVELSYTVVENGIGDIQEVSNLADTPEHLGGYPKSKILSMMEDILPTEKAVAAISQDGDPTLFFEPMTEQLPPQLVMDALKTQIRAQRSQDKMNIPVEVQGSEREQAKAQLDREAQALIEKTTDTYIEWLEGYDPKLAKSLQLDFDTQQENVVQLEGTRVDDITARGNLYQDTGETVRGSATSTTALRSKETVTNRGAFIVLKPENVKPVDQLSDVDNAQLLDQKIREVAEISYNVADMIKSGEFPSITFDSPGQIGATYKAMTDPDSTSGGVLRGFWEFLAGKSRAANLMNELEMVSGIKLSTDARIQNWSKHIREWATKNPDLIQDANRYLGLHALTLTPAERRQVEKDQQLKGLSYEKAAQRFLDEKVKKATAALPALQEKFRKDHPEFSQTLDEMRIFLDTTTGQKGRIINTWSHRVQITEDGFLAAVDPLHRKEFISNPDAKESSVLHDKGFWWSRGEIVKNEARINDIRTNKKLRDEIYQVIRGQYISQQVSKNYAARLPGDPTTRQQIRDMFDTSPETDNAVMAQFETMMANARVGGEIFANTSLEGIQESILPDSIAEMLGSPDDGGIGIPILASGQQAIASAAKVQLRDTLLRLGRIEHRSEEGGVLSDDPNKKDSEKRKPKEDLEPLAEFGPEFKGMYGSRSVRLALKEVFEAPSTNAAKRWLGAAIGFSHRAVTTLSTAATIRQIVASPMFALTAGDWGANSHKSFADAAITVINAIYRDPKSPIGENSILRDFGIETAGEFAEIGRNKNIQDQEIGLATAKSIQDQAKVESLERALKDAQALGKATDPKVIKAKTKSLLNFFDTTFQTSDNVWKAYGFLEALAVEKEAHPEWFDANGKIRTTKVEKGKTVKTSEFRDEAINNAANHVKQHYPTMTRMFGWAQGLKKLYLASFVSFLSEASRIGVMAPIYSYRDFKTGNPAYMKRGIKGMLGYAAAASMATFGYAAISALVNGLDDEEIEDYRSLLAPWERDSRSLWFFRDGEGNLRHMNLEFTNYLGNYANPVMAAWEEFNRSSAVFGTEKAAAESAVSFARALAAPATQFQILPGAIIEAAGNFKFEGGQVTNPELPFAQNMADRFAHVGVTLVPASLRWLGKAPDMVRGENRRGEPVDWVEEVGRGLIPQPRRTITFEKTAKAKMYDLAQRFRNADQIFRAEARGKTSEDAIQKVEAWSDTAFKDTSMELVGVLKGLKRLKGYDEKQAKAIARQAGIPAEVLKNAEIGRISNFRPSERVLNESSEINKVDTRDWLMLDRDEFFEYE